MLIVSTFAACRQGLAQVVAETKDFAIIAEQVLVAKKGQKAAVPKFTYVLSPKGSAAAPKEAVRFESYDRMRPGLYQVRQNGKNGVLDLNSGKMILPAIYPYNIQLIGDSIIVARIKMQTLYRTDGSKLIDAEFKDVQRYEPGRILYDKSAKDLVLYDYSGRKLASFPDTKIAQFHDDEMVLEQKGKYGIFTMKGLQVIPLEYEDIFFGEQYLSLAKKNRAGQVKYGMFTSSDLATTVFPFEYDYVRDISINRDFNDFGYGFIAFDARKNILDIVDDQKKPVTQFSRFPDLKTGWETTRHFAGLDILSDYYAMIHDDGYYRIFLGDGQSIADAKFDYCSSYENKLDGYLFFQSEQTYILPRAYKSDTEYVLPFAVYNIERISDKAYFISTDYGDNIFRPSGKELLLNSQKIEMGLDYGIYESVGIVYLSDYKGHAIAYDAKNDTLVFKAGPKHKEDIEQRLADYLQATVAPYLWPRTSDPVDFVLPAPADNGQEGMFDYLAQDGRTVFENVPYQLQFNRVVAEDGQSVFFTLQAEVADLNYWSVHAVFDESFNMILPFTAGTLTNIYTYESDTIFLSSFTTGDFRQAHSVRSGRTIDYLKLSELSGKKSMYPVITRHGIIAGSGPNGLIGFDGRLIVPFKYDFAPNDAEYIDQSVMIFHGPKESRYYFTQPKQVVTVPYGGWGFDPLPSGSNAFVMRTGKEKYSVYDIRTAQLVSKEVFNAIGFPDGGHYMIVAKGKLYGIFDLLKLELVETVSHSQDDIYRIFAEKYANR